MSPRRPRRGASERSFPNLNPHTGGSQLVATNWVTGLPTPQHAECLSLRPVNTEHAEARGHGGFLELAYAHLNHFTFDLF